MTSFFTDKTIFGVGTALVTPFTAGGAVDAEALAALVEQQITGGVDYLVVLGSTAETPTLSPADRETVKTIVVRACRNRVPLVLGMGGNNTAALTDEIAATDLSGFAALLSVCPYYNKPSQRGLAAHFDAVAKASPLPVIIYNVPGRTGVNILPETVVAAAAANNNIIGIKEASGNPEQIHRLATLARQTPELAGRPFSVISGDDGLTPELIANGDVCGVISVLSNAYSRRWSEVIHRLLKEPASGYDGRFAHITDLLFREGNPAGIKALLNIQGMAENVLRLPLTAVTETLYGELKLAHGQISGQLKTKN